MTRTLTHPLTLLVRLAGWVAAFRRDPEPDVPDVPDVPALTLVAPGRLTALAPEPPLSALITRTHPAGAGRAENPADRLSARLVTPSKHDAPPTETIRRVSPKAGPFPLPDPDDSPVFGDSLDFELEPALDTPQCWPGRAHPDPPEVADIVPEHLLHPQHIHRSELEEGA